MNDLLMYATPVALAGLGETIGQKSGVINIGLEGMMLSGAFTALCVVVPTQNPLLAFLAGGLVGLLIALLQGWFTLKLALDQIVVGTAFNLIALGLTSTLFRQQYGSSGALLSLPTLPKWMGLDVAIALGIVAAALFWFGLNKTRLGLALRAVGENPTALEAAGFSASKLRFFAVCVGGVFGGLAGAYLCIGSAGSFAEDMTKGYGFVAIAMVTFGRWNPIGVYAAAILIGYLEGLQFQLQAYGLQAPPQLFLAMPYLVALLVLVFIGRASRAPSSLGVPYKKEGL